MQGRRNPFVAHEGIPFLLGTIVFGWVAYRYLNLYWVAAAIFVFVVLYLVFRDPRRRIPAAPLGVVSPVDGMVTEIELADKMQPPGEVHRVVIRINSLGTYTARCPVEGKIMNLRSDDAASMRTTYPTNALWVRTDEGDDVILQFHGYRFGLAPKSFIRFGERLGQGSRCAYLRLARYAEVHLPVDSKVLVEVGQITVAGRDLLGKLLQP